MTGRADLLDPLFAQLSAHVLDAAIELKVAELIAGDTVTMRELAARTGTDPGGLARLVRALAALGVVEQTEPDLVRLTGTGALLRPDRPDSILAYAQLLTPSSVLMAGWRRLADAVRTGRPVFADIHGTDFFDYLSSHGELSAWFTTSMRQGTLPVASVLPDSYDFARHDVVVDVGGGDGTLLVPLLAAHSHLRAVLFDTVLVETGAGLGEAARVLAAGGVADRCERRAGDFFVEVPAGADLYLVKNVLHDWDDDRAVLILSNCRRAVPDDGRVLIIEQVLPAVADRSMGPRAYLSDLNMLVNLGGTERTEAEFGRLCGRAGLSVETVRPLGSTGKTVIETRPIPARR